MDDMFFVRLMRLARERDIVAHLYYDWREDQYHLCFQRCQVTGEIATSNATIDNRSFISSDRKAQEQIILDILDKAEMELCSTPNGKDAQGGDKAMKEDIFIRMVQMAKERDIAVSMGYSWMPDLYYLDFRHNRYTGGVTCWRVPIYGAKFRGTTEEEKNRMLLEILEKAEKELCRNPESQNIKEEVWS